MKTRLGFVSNSSSSSFILKTEEDRKFCDRYNIKYFKVTLLIDYYRPIVEFKKKYKELDFYNNGELPSFFENDFWSFNDDSIENRYQELLEMEEKYPNCYISSSYDRDDAYDNNFYFEVFEGDL